MIKPVPPAFIFMAGALLVPLLKGRLKAVYLIALPVLAFVDLLAMDNGTYWIVRFLNQDLIFGRVDRLSMVFGYVFVLITFIGVIYALHVKDDGQHVAALLYAGGALGVTFVGDLISLYFFWEAMALASVFLILARKTEDSNRAALRYFLWHFFGGLCLLAGIVLYALERDTIAFAYIGLSDPSTYLIFIGFCLNAVVFPLHVWLSDAYPRATVTGAVFMSALTTKSAVYILARTFPGTPFLIWAGALMTCFPIFYAVIANDMRRVLSYSLINQVGFMVCGIGIGTQLAINGVAAHAFCHIIYKALLFMSTGAVLHMTGKIRGTDLGGLYKTMPYTAVCCMIGAASISAFPLFSGFISKSMTVTAVAEEHFTIVWFMLLFASAGVFHHAGIKVPYFIFFGHDSGIRAKEPPVNMRIAMGMAAFICLFLGVYPDPLYRILPYPVDFVPYTAFHVLGMLELLMFGALAFTLLVLSGYYPAEMRAVNLDTDWFLRLPGRQFILFCQKPLQRFFESMNRILLGVVGTLKTWPRWAVGTEEKNDYLFHKKLTAFPEFIYARARYLKTEIKQLSFNLTYILLFFVVLLWIMLYWTG
ncbi:MAG: Na(+)/H(+) antiporter subunit D [Deltaproteobacteria bacterium]|nr:Na(+)/H(+) antiporter subunit D [Deltaproteobacteria bacterium]